MILHWDGSWPLLMVALMITFFFITRKDKKEMTKIQNNIDQAKLNMIDYERARDDIHNGAKILKIDDYKHLTQRDIDFYTELHGVKFV